MDKSVDAWNLNDNTFNFHQVLILVLTSDSKLLFILI